MSDNTAVDAVRELLSQAKRLNLIWTLIPATVAPITGAVNVWPSSNTYVIQDNDINVSRAMSLVGCVRGGTRVMIMHVPPQGNYIIGYIGGQAPDAVGVIARTRRTTNSSSTTTEIGVLRLDGVPLFAGRLYEFRTNAIEVDSTVANDGIRLLLRYTTNGTVATTTSDVFTISQLIQVNAGHGEYIQPAATYVPPVDQILSLLLTVTRSIGTGSVNTVAGSGLPGPTELLVVDHGRDVGDTGVQI